MRVPLSWLRDYVPLPMPAGELADRLSISAAEVITLEPRGPVDANGNHGLFLVGKVLEAGKHPNADRLQLCQVDVGEGSPRQIVCGAWNFAAGATVAVALPGAKLPGAEAPLGEAKLRGEVSRGMILSERELELGTDHAGIMVLPEAEPGTPLADVLPLADLIMDVDPTGNRVDLLCIYGVAREVAALFELELAPPPGVDPEPRGTESVNIRIDDLEGCPRYVGRTFGDVRLGPSPPWLRARLTGAGMRPISNVVDITNYVMLALGNPLHAFDRTTLAGDQIVVRRADARREAPDARRRRARARGAGSRDRRRGAGDRARGDHGRRGDGGARFEHRDPARGGQFRAVRAAADLRAAQAANRGLESLGEGRRSVSRAAGGVVRDAAPRRARGRPVAGRQRRPRRAAAPARRPVPSRSRRRADRARDASRRAAEDSHRLRLRSR